MSPYIGTLGIGPWIWKSNPSVQQKITGWAKKNAHKTETFLLFWKIVKKLIVMGINIINSIITQWETVLWWTEGIFLQKIKGNLRK